VQLRKVVDPFMPPVYLLADDQDGEKVGARLGMIANYTPSDRPLNIAALLMKARMAGTRRIGAS